MTLLAALLAGAAVAVLLRAPSSAGRLEGLGMPGRPPRPGRARGLRGRAPAAAADGRLLAGRSPGRDVGDVPPAEAATGRPTRPLSAHLAHLARWRADRGRRSRADPAATARALSALAAELRAGRPPGPALAAVADDAGPAAADALRTAAATAGVGGDPAAVLAGADGLRGLAACWRVCASTGSGLAPAVERLAESERDAVARRRAVRAELAGPRATARLLAGLPVLGLLLAAALGAHPLAVLVGTPAGRVCLVLGVALEVVGLRWTAALARRAERGALS